jgi:hypothetical protein
MIDRWKTRLQMHRRVVEASNIVQLRCRRELEDAGAGQIETT